MSETSVKIHAGSCHCGAVAYEVDVGLDGLMECNCSHCYRKGFVLAFAPRSAFRLTKGEGETTSYFFNQHKIGIVSARPVACSRSVTARPRTAARLRRSTSAP